MVELLQEDRLTFAQMAHRAQVNVSTVWRWALRGCRGVQLESFTSGGRRFTTAQAYARFVAATTAAAVGAPATASARCTNQVREARIRRAEAELANELGSGEATARPPRSRNRD